jgi:hypothetical protein
MRFPGVTVQGEAYVHVMRFLFTIVAVVRNAVLVAAGVAIWREAALGIYGVEAAVLSLK